MLYLVEYHLKNIRELICYVMNRIMTFIDLFCVHSFKCLYIAATAAAAVAVVIVQVTAISLLSKTAFFLLTIYPIQQQKHEC